MASNLTTPPATVYGIEKRSEDGDQVSEIGHLTIETDGKLRLVDAQADYADVLGAIMQAVNDRPTLSLKVPPSDPDDPDSRGIAWQNVARDDPAFALLLAPYFEQKYDLYLVDPNEPRLE
jgi:hypothetical protein